MMRPNPEQLRQVTAAVFALFLLLVGAYVATAFSSSALNQRVDDAVRAAACNAVQCRDGVAGADATIRVAPAATLPADSDATVNNTGNATAARYVFGVPRGETGEAGEAGADANITVTLNASGVLNVTVLETTHANLTILVLGNGTYIAVPGPRGAPGEAAVVTAGNTTSGAPDSNATLVNAGTPLAAVLDATVPRGATGAAATLVAGNTTSGPSGGNATVVNAANASAAVLDFEVPRGVPGEAATVAAGNTTQLTPGSEATVVNVGSSMVAVLDVGVPRGAQGAQGQQANVTVNVVTSANSTSNFTEFFTPSSNITLELNENITFETLPGTTGAQGAAATFSVGSVTTGVPGSEAAVVNAGTSGAVVADFTVPRGPSGAVATVAVGNVTTLVAGSLATVSATGTTGNIILDFGVPRGAAGAGVNVSIGNVTTLTPGSEATVSATGSMGDILLDFGVPRGATGATGASATVTIGNVTTLATGTPGTVAGTAILNVGVPIGPTGATGAPATASGNSIVTLAAGSNATVTNVGSSAAAVLNFGIPRGAQGVQGAAATITVGTVSTLPTGSSGTVVNSGSSSAAAFAFGIPIGPTGTTGAAATVAVGTVATLGAGSTPTVTNVGSSAAAVLNFGLPLTPANGAVLYNSTGFGSQAFTLNTWTPLGAVIGFTFFFQNFDSPVVSGANVLRYTGATQVLVLGLVSLSITYTTTASFFIGIGTASPPALICGPIAIGATQLPIVCQGWVALSNNQEVQAYGFATASGTAQLTYPSFSVIG